MGGRGREGTEEKRLDELVTLSFNAAGCSPVWRTILAAPCIAASRDRIRTSAVAQCRKELSRKEMRRNDALCAANSSASLRGSPIMTPPSAMASRTTQTKAGPEPQTAVTASKCCKRRKRERGGEGCQPFLATWKHAYLGADEHQGKERCQRRRRAHLLVHEAGLAQRGEESGQDLAVDRCLQIARVEG